MPLLLFIVKQKWFKKISRLHVMDKGYIFSFYFCLTIKERKDLVEKKS